MSTFNKQIHWDNEIKIVDGSRKHSVMYKEDEEDKFSSNLPNFQDSQGAQQEQLHLDKLRSKEDVGTPPDSDEDEDTKAKKEKEEIAKAKDKYRGSFQDEFTVAKKQLENLQIKDEDEEDTNDEIDEELKKNTLLNAHLGK